MPPPEKDLWREIGKLLQNEDPDELGESLREALGDRDMFIRLLPTQADRERIFAILDQRAGQNLALIMRIWYTNLLSTETEQ